MNEGEWSYVTADYTARNGHLEIVEWIKYVEPGNWSDDLRKNTSFRTTMIRDVECTIISFVNA